MHACTHLDGACEEMAIVGQACGERGSIEEHKLLGAVPRDVIAAEGVEAAAAAAAAQYELHKHRDSKFGCGVK